MKDDKNESNEGQPPVGGSHERVVRHPGLRFATETSGKPETCWRCSTLGLPANGIAPGEPHLVIYDDDKVTNRACGDCYERLREEIAKMSEGEEWKDA